MRLSQWLASFLRSTRTGAPRKPRALCVEALEERCVPAILFNNVSTTPVVSQGSVAGFPIVLGNTPVYLIYWGSSWGQSGSGPSMQSINNATASLLSGPYLSSLGQYASGLD